MGEEGIKPSSSGVEIFAFSARDEVERFFHAGNAELLVGIAPGINGLFNRQDEFRAPPSLVRQPGAEVLLMFSPRVGTKPAVRIIPLFRPEVKEDLLSWFELIGLDDILQIFVLPGGDCDFFDLGRAGREDRDGEAFDRIERVREHRVKLVVLTPVGDGVFGFDLIFPRLPELPDRGTSR